MVADNAIIRHKVIDFSTLSLVMIVKDEEDNLGRCLDSVKSIVDEIIIVDTGSTDRTINIAESYGAKVFYHKWTGSFSEARNASLDNATCDWVMFLDADEELVREDAAKLKKLLNDPEHEGFFFTLLNFIGEKVEDSVLVNPAFRLWRNKPEYRFSGKIHEQILDKIQQNNLNVDYSGVRINHYGYLRQAIIGKDKIKRNLDILLKEVEQDPDNSFARFNLGVQYLRLSEFDKALEHYKVAFANLQNLNASYASVLIRNIAICLKELHLYKEALCVLEDAKATYPDYTDLFYLEGLIHIDRNEYESAILCFKTCLKMGPAGERHVSQAGVGSHIAAYALAQCYESIGDEREAVNSYQKALECNPRDCASISKLGQMLVCREALTNLQQFLEQLVDMKSGDVLLAMALVFSRGRHYDISLGYLDRLVDVGPSSSQIALVRGECLLNLKRFSEAIAEFDKVAASSRYYPAASKGKAICHVIGCDYEAAAEVLELAKDANDSTLIYEIYSSLINLLKGQSLSIASKIYQGEQAKEILSDLLGKLIRLEEFDVYEKAVKLLNEIGFSAGEVSLLLGKLYYGLGYHDIAAEELIRACTHDCIDGEAFSILGKTSFDNKLYEEAKVFFLKALNNGIEEINIYTSLARALIRLGEINQASEVLGMAVKKYPNTPLIAELKQSMVLQLLK